MVSPLYFDFDMSRALTVTTTRTGPYQHEHAGKYRDLVSTAARTLCWTRYMSTTCMGHQVRVQCWISKHWLSHAILGRLYLSCVIPFNLAMEDEGVMPARTSSRRRGGTPIKQTVSDECTSSRSLVACSHGIGSKLHGRAS